MATQNIRLKDADGNVLLPETEWKMVLGHPIIKTNYLLKGTVDGYAGTCTLIFNILDSDFYAGIAYFFSDFPRDLPTAVSVRAKNLITASSSGDYSIMDIAINFAGGVKKKFVPNANPIRVNLTNAVLASESSNHNRQNVFGADGYGPYSFTKIFSSLTEFNSWVGKNPFVAMSSTFFFVEHAAAAGEEYELAIHKLELDIGFSGRDLNELKQNPVVSKHIFYKDSPNSATYKMLTSLDTSAGSGVILGMITYSPSYEYGFNWESLLNSQAF